MCIAVIVINFDKRFPLIICHNRDEDPTRPTSGLELREGILSAVDLRASGVAAVGMNTETGSCAILTNSRNVFLTRKDGVSRGQLIKNVLLEFQTERTPDHILSKTYQGGFYLFMANCFIRDGVTIDYISNVDGNWHERFAEGSESRILIKMNEHPISQDDWCSKINHVRARFSEWIKSGEKAQTLDEIFTTLEGIMSETENTELSAHKTSNCSWSPCPAAESRLLSNILIPQAEIAPGTSFGTVSQTMIVVDKQNHQVHYRYRTVNFPLFSDWDHRVIEY
jgi:uncharacterized protein with NRDE domain